VARRNPDAAAIKRTDVGEERSSMTPWNVILGQCPCSGGSRYAGAIWLLAAGSLYAVAWWAESVKRKEGKSRMIRKLGKLAVVVALVAAVGVVAAMKKTRSSGPATQPAIAAGQVQASAGLPRLLDLGSTSCIPCKMMAPILEQLKAEQAGRLQVDFIDVWVDKAAGEKYAINLIPTQIFFDASGRELWRHEGFLAKDEILAKWKQLGVEPAGAASQPVAEREGANRE
jgi:thioredoxin 1